MPSLPEKGSKAANNIPPPPTRLPRSRTTSSRTTTAAEYDGTTTGRHRRFVSFDFHHLNGTKERTYNNYNSGASAHQKTVDENDNKSLEEQRKYFHEQNQRFLNRAAAANKKHQSTFSTPSPSTFFRKSASPSSNISSHGRTLTSPLRKTAEPSFYYSPRVGFDKKRTRLPSIGDTEELEVISSSNREQGETKQDGAKGGNKPVVVEQQDVGLTSPIPNWHAHTRSVSDASSNLSLFSDDDESIATSTSGSPVTYKSMRKYNQPPSLARFESEQEERRRLLLEKTLIDNRPRSKDRSVRDYIQLLESKRQSLIDQWREEGSNSAYMAHQLPRKDLAPLDLFKQKIMLLVTNVIGLLSELEVFISNLPLTIGAVGLSWVTTGTVWFKLMEKTVLACVPVHYNSPSCRFSEFPACYRCNTSDGMYKIALWFHDICSTIAGMFVLAFVLKTIIARRTVIDELRNPTTATPVGVVCMAILSIVGGRLGVVGELVVLLTSAFQFFFAFWFLYMAIFKFRLYPDPSWFPCTVGISFSAIKTWLYCPLIGIILLYCCIIFFLGTFFISMIRVALSPKVISAPVVMIQLSAPSITLFAMSILAQPSIYDEEVLSGDMGLSARYKEIHHRYYLPVQHTMMILSLASLVSVLHGLWLRWGNFRHVPFSPAHVAFVFPILSHANAMQTYQGDVNNFSTAGKAFKTMLLIYGAVFLVIGTVLNIIITWKFLSRLPQWTKVNLAKEVEPPPNDPSETITMEMLGERSAHELMIRQPFMSPAVLQANDAGALVRVRRGTIDWDLHGGPWVRTRLVPSHGFDPTLNESELRRERAELLDWVAKIPPRTRNRTLSVPTVLQLTGQNDELDFYGTFAQTGSSSSSRGHVRSRTMNEAAPWA